jgi:hypothetical protein
MKAENCREWRESLGAYALDQLPGDERVAVDAHLEGCPACRAELETLAAIGRLLPLADPIRFDTAPAPPKALGKRIAAAIGAEHRTVRRRRFRLGVAFGGATAALAALVLAIFVLPGGGGGEPETHVTFASTPPGLQISAKLIPHSFGTEIHMYVSGPPSGTLCRVYLREPDGTALSAGTFRYRWGDDNSAVLSSALDLSKTASIEVRVGGHAFVAPVDPTASLITRPGGSV